MWILMPSASVDPEQKFFALEDVKALSKALQKQAQNPIPVVKGRIWAGEERQQSWAVECESYEAFCECLQDMAGRVEFLAYDEMVLDDETLHVVQDDLYRYSDEEGLAPELSQKAIAALRGHENEMFAVMAYAFLNSGRVLFARAQNELARFVYHPHRLLSSEGLSSVRKLRTLTKN